jgi:hypothetical protein
MPRAPMSLPALDSRPLLWNSEHFMQIAPSSLLALPLLFQVLAMPAAAQGPTKVGVVLNFAADGGGGVRIAPPRDRAPGGVHSA